MADIQLRTLEEFDDRIRAHGSLDGCIVQGLVLTERSASLLSVSVERAVFLGCSMDSKAALALLQKGAVLFPDLRAGRPYHPMRSSLYGLSELMQGFEPEQPGGFQRSLDFRIYEHFQRYRHDPSPPLLEELAQRIHDHAIDDALGELLRRPECARVVGVMGGHAMKRGSAAFAQVAQIGWLLAQRGYFVATGGGPGAMEAATE